MNELASQEKQCFLLSLDADHTLSPALEVYVRDAPKEVKAARKCKERDPWYCVKQRYVPPAFIHGMSSSWPKIIRNVSQATCTNNIYRLSWKHERESEDWARLSLGSLSTLFQFSSEWCGRSYGSGMLKVEPKEVKELCVPVGQNVETQLAYEVDALVRKNRIEDARNLVDLRFLREALSFTPADVDVLRSARDVLQTRRRHQPVDEVEGDE